MQVAASEFKRKVELSAHVRCSERRCQLAKILEPLGLAELVEEEELELMRELARRLAAIPAPIREEHASAL
jgi:Ser/Thr protein kinase RdoA (MazF antagonist)